MSITEIIEELVPVYLKRFSLKSAHYINWGNCEDFARSVIDALEEIGDEADPIWDDELATAEELESEGFAPYGGHCVILYNDRYYDAECPHGVDDWHDIPFFKNHVPTPA